MPTQPLPLDHLQQHSDLSARDLLESFLTAVALAASVAVLVSWLMTRGA